MFKKLIMKRNEHGVMQGTVYAADFVEDTITLKMAGGYYASAGTFFVVPSERYGQLLAIENKYLSSLGPTEETA